MLKEVKLVYVNPVHAGTAFALVALVLSGLAIGLIKVFLLLDPTLPTGGMELDWVIGIVVVAANTLSAFIVGSLVSVAFNLAARATGGIAYRVRLPSGANGDGAANEN
jgi:hypothetical protein